MFHLDSILKNGRSVNGNKTIKNKLTIKENQTSVSIFLI